MSINQIRSLKASKKEWLYQQLNSIYKKLDQNLSSIPQPCTGCGECCNFSKAEHRLYGSSLELAMLLDKAEKKSKDLDQCPYQIEGKCSIRDLRLIGCRTYYRLHNKVHQEQAEIFYEEALKAVKELLSEEGLAWEYKDLMSCFPSS